MFLLCDDIVVQIIVVIIELVMGLMVMVLHVRRVGAVRSRGRGGVNNCMESGRSDVVTDTGVAMVMTQGRRSTVDRKKIPFRPSHGSLLR